VARRRIIHLGAGIFLVCIQLCLAADAPTRLLRFADIAADKVVFTYEDDLWTAPVAGGDAQRLTRGDGAEIYAKFSPDGRFLAFTAEYDGNKDVYVMDARGGTPQRLTYHPADDRVLEWFPDGQSILFRSNREYPQRAEEVYRVSVRGGMPEKLPVDRAGLATLSPDGKKIAYNRISREFATWKRHQGGTAMDIWMGALADGNFQKITDWPGDDNFPMWAGDAIYFTSDRNKGTLNLFKYNAADGVVTALTDYPDYDVKYPSMGDGRIVFQYGEMLHVLDLATGKLAPIPIIVRSDGTRLRPELQAAVPKTGTFRLSPTGKRLVLECRGDIVTVPAEEGAVRNVTHAPASREKNPAWSPDGASIAFFSDKTGEEELYVADVDGLQPWRQLTHDGDGFRLAPVWSPDSKHLLYSDKYMRLQLVDASSGAVTTVDRGEYDEGWERWGIQDYVWSPDSAWIAYTKEERSLNDCVYLYSIADKKGVRVTDEMVSSWSPSFDPEGRYLYFLSNRTFKPVMGSVDQNYVFTNMTRAYLLLLKADAASPFAPEDAAEAARDEDASAKKDSKDEKKGDATPDIVAPPKPVAIDLDGIERRIVAAEGIPAGTYYRLEAAPKGFTYLRRTEPQFSKYEMVTDQTTDEFDLHHYDLKEKESKRCIGGITNYHLSHDGKKLVYRAGSKYGIVDVGKEAKVGDGLAPVDDIRVRVERGAEFLQIFNEAWRIERDWFYDQRMHAIDWPAIGEKYRQFVPFCGTRGDLSYLIGEMIGELDAGHTYVMGGDLESARHQVKVGLLGADFVAEAGAGYFRIAHIIRGTPGDPDERSPLDVPGCPIREGHYLIAIDGQPVTTDDNVYAFLQDKADRLVDLTYNDRPSPDGAKTFKVQALASEWSIRYREWVENNRAIVDKASGGRIGYVHIPNMQEAGIIEFEKVFFPAYYKDAFVIDERYNGGGFTSDMLVDRLERKVWSWVQPREGKPQPNPERAFGGAMVVLINEDTGSSGEWFAECIKRRGIAPLLGMRTWGGSIGIEPHQPLVDGGSVTAPQFAPFGLDGTWPIEGHGVDPDIEVQNMPVDVLRGRDAQLETAVQYLLEAVTKNPPLRPTPPPYPDKRKK
jgi:tricorn protease